MTSHKTPFLDFYGSHNISPVAQNISNIARHFDRRNALYRHCGLPPALLYGKNILELGPGTGHNAIFTNAMAPHRYVLVDANDKSLKETKKQLATYFDDTSNCTVINSIIEKFSSDTCFDAVFCEGVIPIQHDPAAFLRKLATFVAPGGFLLITCVDYVSFFSEALRRVAGRLLLHESDIEITSKIERLRPFYLKHLSTLEGMSRSCDDWIYDNILQPIPGDFFSIKDAVKSINDSFDVYSSSPNFITDWRWYKDIYGEQAQYNERVIECYTRNIHNLLDYRYVFDPIDFQAGNILVEKCKMAYLLAEKICKKRRRQEIIELTDLCRELVQLIEPFSKNTAASLKEYISAINLYLAGKNFPENLPLFAPWFGRGQQYVSFIKRQDFGSVLKAK